MRSGSRLYRLHKKLFNILKLNYLHSNQFLTNGRVVTHETLISSLIFLGVIDNERGVQ
jgi:hypothetical protein